MHLKVLENNRLKRKNNDMKKTTLFLMLLMTMLSLQNAKADSAALDACNVSSNVTATWEGDILKVVDGDKGSHWWTRQTQVVDDHITVEFPELQNFGNIVITFAETDFPTKAAIEISSNGTEWNSVVAFTENDIKNHEIVCNANGAQAKYVRLRVAETCGRWLKVKEIEVFPYASRTVSAKTTTGGTITINGGTDPVESTDKVILLATPSTGYQFQYWKIGEEIISYSYIHEDLSASDVEYTAVFIETPALRNNKYFIKSIGTGNYLTVKKYNVTDQEGSYKTEAKNDGNDQIFKLEPAFEYNKYYVKSESGYYLNCESWNAYAQSEKTTPILFEEIETGIYALYQTTSTHKAGYLNIQTNHENGLYCDADAANDNYKKWTLEIYEEVDKSELQELIAEAETLFAKVADYSKVEGDKITISGKITSNAAQNNADGNSGGNPDGKGIAGLTDDDVTTYFHSRWGGTAVNEDHYLQIDLGEDNTLSDFCFSYSVRKGNSETETSPAPTVIEVRVSEDERNFGNPIITFTKDGNSLPAYTDLGATLWHSGVISAGKNIRYIRLTVTGSEGPGTTEWEGHKFFAMSALNLYQTRLTEEYSAVKEKYNGIITVEQITTAVQALSSAKTINESNSATSTQVNDVANTLDAALEALRVDVVSSYTLNVSAAGWASLYLDFPAAIPDFGDEEAGVYIVTGVKEGNYLNLVKVTEGVLPANTGVIVKAAQGTYDFMYSEEGQADVSGNLLKGSVVDEYIEGKAYVLGNKSGIGFYQAELNKNATGNAGDTHFKNNAYKSYLLSSDIFGVNKSAGFRFAFGGTTAVEDVEIVNEKEEIYDLTGRKLSEITKPGIYIVKGKKVLVK